VDEQRPQMVDFPSAGVVVEPVVGQGGGAAGEGGEQAVNLGGAFPGEDALRPGHRTQCLHQPCPRRRVGGVGAQ
jgi:hypothetical protein